MSQTGFKWPKYKGFALSKMQICAVQRELRVQRITAQFSTLGFQKLAGTTF